MFVVLAIASVGRIIAVRSTPPDHRRERLQSLGSWWVITAIIAATALLGGVAAAVVFAVVSLFAMREFVTITSIDKHAVPVWSAYALIPLNYLWLILDWRDMFVLFIPLAALLGIAVVTMVTSPIKGFTARAARLQWGLLLTVYAMSHTVLLFSLPESFNPVAGPAGLYLYLLILTETNDVAQALVGRRVVRISRHTITERISPNKTWEGWIGGCIVTIALSAALAPVLTPFAHSVTVSLRGATVDFPYGWAVIIGIVIAVTGFLGDINMSAVKRDAGVKDSGRGVPGQGGVIDRIDSLTFTAPVFYYLVLGISHAGM